MDVTKTIRQLKIEKERVERTIAILEGLQTGTGVALVQVPKPRGRKSMSPEERREVSARMKRYWANRRQGQPD